MLQQQQTFIALFYDISLRQNAAVQLQAHNLLLLLGINLSGILPSAL